MAVPSREAYRKGEVASLVGCGFVLCVVFFVAALEHCSGWLIGNGFLNGAQTTSTSRVRASCKISEFENDTPFMAPSS